MRGFLKCFYGYRNLGDEILFWGVLEYIDTMYGAIDELTIEVGDVAWMQSRRERNSLLMRDISIATGFISHAKIIKFVDKSNDVRDNFNYDMYFFGGGEVFAQSRGFHGGRNYLLRYPRVFCAKPFVLLGGLETPTTLRQKILYRLVLPRATKIVCRDETSYALSQQYTKHTVLFSDFAVPVVDKYRQLISGHHTQTLTSHNPYDLHAIDTLTGKKYITINIIASMSTDESYRMIDKFIQRYPDHTIVYVGCGKNDQGISDTDYGKWLQGAYSDMILYDWTQYSLAQTLYLMEHTQAGMGCRLHFLLLLQELERDRYALVYAEKINKLITSTLSFS